MFLVIPLVKPVVSEKKDFFLLTLSGIHESMYEYSMLLSFIESIVLPSITISIPFMIIRMILFNGFPLVADSGKEKYTDPGRIISFLPRFGKRISKF